MYFPFVYNEKNCMFPMSTGQQFLDPKTWPTTAHAIFRDDFKCGARIDAEPKVFETF